MSDTRDQMVATNVRTVLDEKGWSRASFARELGKPYQWVQRRLWSEVAWSAGELLDVAEVLDVPVERLLGEDQ